jgi:hypothetical protein
LERPVEWSVAQQEWQAYQDQQLEWLAEALECLVEWSVAQQEWQVYQDQQLAWLAEALECLVELVLPLAINFRLEHEIQELGSSVQRLWGPCIPR